MFAVYFTELVVIPKLLTVAEDFTVQILTDTFIF